MGAEPFHLAGPYSVQMKTIATGTGNSMDDMAQRRGSVETLDYYEREGWDRSDGGVLRDHLRWGSTQTGPVRARSHVLRRRRVREALGRAGLPLSMLECGCGGNPAVDLLPLCARYTALDFSARGLGQARKVLSGHPIPFGLVEADMCAMPFPDSVFDAVYSANALYHIRDAQGQAVALTEMARVTRPGGVVVLIVANPRPLLFPGRLLVRLAADAPRLGPLVDRLCTPAPIPYNPRPLSWMARTLAPLGEVTITSYTIPSMWFNQRIAEKRGVGRLAWHGIEWLERAQPVLAGRLGCYVQITLRVHKRGGAQDVGSGTSSASSSPVSPGSTSSSADAGASSDAPAAAASRSANASS